MTTRVAINGFGRIGRNVLRAIAESGRNDIEVVAINDLGPVETNAHLLQFDSVHGRFPREVAVKGNAIDIGYGPIEVTAERDPATLLWNAPASSPPATRLRCIWKTGRSGSWFRPPPKALTRRWFSA